MNRMKYFVFVVMGVFWTGGICFSDDWPQFRGPSRDGKSAETGLLKKWPEGRPELLWSVLTTPKAFGFEAATLNVYFHRFN